ncbi:MAG: DUF6175 family protein [Fibrobacterales bacterium]
MKYLLSSLVAISLVVMGCASKQSAPQSNMPKSMESAFVETYSPAEVTIKAVGYGNGDEDVAGALLDAKRAAVYYILYGGSDGIINSKEGKMKFELFQEQFFADVQKYITWESDKVISQVRTPRGIKVTKMFRVNKKNVTDRMVERGVVTSSTELAESQGMPFIMVVPETSTKTSVMDVYNTNPYAKHAATTIESYLTARQYDVVVPKQLEQVNTIAGLELGNESEEDVSYQLALSIGADVYISFAGTVKNNKASVSVKAYETTTARLLGAETGYSKNRPGAAPEALIEEGLADAIDKVLQRVNNYWTKDLERGLQYKLIFRMLGDYEGDQLENIQFAVADVTEAAFSKSKENVITKKTMDYNVWGSPDTFDKSSKIYRHYKRKLGSKGIKARKITLNRKLILIGIE